MTPGFVDYADDWIEPDPELSGSDGYDGTETEEEEEE